MKKPYAQVERDMLWFFNHAEAAIGFKSSHASFVSALYGVSSTNVETDPYTDGMLKQVRKLRHIRNVYYSLPISVRQTLQLCYQHECQMKMPVELVKLYGTKAGCSLMNTQMDTLEEFTRLARKKINSKLSEKEEIIMFNIGVETRNLWEDVHKQYMLARQKVLNKKSANEIDE